MTVLFKMLASTEGELFGLTESGHVYLLNAERTGWLAIPDAVLDVQVEGPSLADVLSAPCAHAGCHELVRAPQRVCRTHRIQGE